MRNPLGADGGLPAFCVIVTVRPATVNVPDRADVVGFPATV